MQMTGRIYFDSTNFYYGNPRGSARENMRKPVGVVYGIRNLLDGKVYIGATKDYPTRMKIYRYEAKHPNVTKRTNGIAGALNRDGIENFKFFIIAECTSELEMHSREMYYIKHYNSADPACGYNQHVARKGGVRGKGKTKGKHHTEEWKNNIRLAIIAHSAVSGAFKIYSSASEIANHIGCDRSIITRACRHALAYKNIRYFYADDDRRNEVLLEAESHNRIQKREWKEIANFINSVGVETIESKTFKF